MSAYRHTRQVRLAEIGEAGQARLSRASIAVRGGGASGALEARYLAGAGVAELRVEDDATARAALRVDGAVRVLRVGRVVGEGSLAPAGATPLDGALADLEPAALDVARAAWRALDAIRRALAGDAPPSQGAAS